MLHILFSLPGLALLPRLLCFPLIGFDLFQYRLLPINDCGQGIRQDLTDTPAHLFQFVKAGLYRFKLGGQVCAGFFQCGLLHPERFHIKRKSDLVFFQQAERPIEPL